MKSITEIDKTSPGFDGVRPDQAEFRARLQHADITSRLSQFVRRRYHAQMLEFMTTLVRWLHYKGYRECFFVCSTRYTRSHTHSDYSDYHSSCYNALCGWVLFTECRSRPSGNTLRVEHRSQSRDDSAITRARGSLFGNLSGQKSSNPTNDSLFYAAAHTATEILAIPHWPYNAPLKLEKQCALLSMDVAEFVKEVPEVLGGDLADFLKEVSAGRSFGDNWRWDFLWSAMSQANDAIDKHAYALEWISRCAEGDFSRWATHNGAQVRFKEVDLIMDHTLGWIWPKKLTSTEWFFRVLEITLPTK